MEQDERTEREESWLRVLLRLVGIIALITLGLVAVVVASCWFGGWNAASQISNSTILAGVTTIAVGILSTLGGWSLTRDP